MITKRRLSMLRGSVAGALSVLVAIAASGSGLVGANPVISSVAPDPSALRGSDGAFHVYATSDDWSDGAGYRLIPHFRSFDLVDWTYVGDAFSERPTWHPAGSLMWAPDVHEIDGRFLMYYTTGGARPCIGLATSPTEAGPWTDTGEPIVCMGDGTHPDLDPMDPNVDFSGPAPVMYMGNFEGLHAVEMNADGTELVGDPVLVAGDHFEAPTVLHREGHTHLLMSTGHCCLGENSRYRVVAGRGEGQYGPFVDRAGRDLRSGGGDVILRDNDDWVGPGHTDVVVDDAGDDWLLYHAAPRGSAVLPNGIQFRQMLIDRLDWVDGWPVVGDGTPSTSRPVVPHVDLPVRLDGRGDVTVEGTEEHTVVTTPAELSSTGDDYSGRIWATVTGPSKVPEPVRIRSGDDLVDSVSASVGVTGPERFDLDLVLPAHLPVGLYELVLHVGAEVGATEEMAVFGLQVEPDGGPPAPGSLGSVQLGSVPAGSSAAGLLPAGSFGS